MQPLVVFVYLFEELHNGFGTLLSSPSTTAFDHESPKASWETNNETPIVPKRVCAVAVHK